MTFCIKILMTYEAGAFNVVVLGGAVERRVLALVGGIQFDAAVHQLLNNAVAAVPAGPMQQTETVVVTCWIFN